MFRTMPLSAALLAASLCISSGEAQAQRDPAMIASVERVTAIVESIDLPRRTVLLQREDGSFLTMRIGDEVRNLAQVKAGDRVVVEHTEAIAASMAKPGTPPVVAADAASRAQPGARPGAATADVVRVRVTIDQVFGTGDTVSFTGPTGAKRTIAIRTPQMREFARGLRPGDEVDVTFIDTVAIRVEPAP